MNKSHPMVGGSTPNQQRMDWRFFYWLIPVTLVLLLALRELRVVSFQLASQQMAESNTSSAISSFSGSDTNLVRQTAYRLDDISGAELSSQTIEAAKQLSGRVFGSGSQPGQIKLVFKESKLGGFWWLPLFKWGHYRCVAECDLLAARNGSKSEIRLKWEFNLDGRAVGSMSALEFRRQFGNKIAEALDQSIRRQLDDR
jgi:hypothetical protein